MQKQKRKTTQNSKTTIFLKFKREKIINVFKMGGLQKIETETSFKPQYSTVRAHQHPELTHMN